MRAIATSRACPLCAGRRARRVWPDGEYWFVRCTACGGFFSNITEDQYLRARQNAWTEGLPTAEAVDFYGPARERAHRQFLDRHPPVGDARLLDVGCGLGYFLAQARRRGWEVAGVDPSPAWVELANRRLGSARVELARLEESAAPAGSFALITAWDVLEHVFEPIRFLARLRALLAPGGRLFIRTPNIAYVYPVYAARRWLLGQEIGLGPTNHVVYFSAATMRRALARAGLRAVAWPVHVPPQVAPRAWSTPGELTGQSALIGCKNSYSRLAERLAERTGGAIVLGSDLDVVCAAAAAG